MPFNRRTLWGFWLLLWGLWACKSIEGPPEVPQYWEERKSWETQGVVFKLHEISPEDSLVYSVVQSNQAVFHNELLGLTGSVPIDSQHFLYDAIWLGGNTWITRIGSTLVQIALTNSPPPVVDTLEDPTDLQYLAPLPDDPQAFVAVPENSSLYYRVSFPSLDRQLWFTGVRPPHQGFSIRNGWILDARGILYDSQGNVLFQDTTLGRFYTFGPDSWLIFVPDAFEEHLGMVYWPTGEVQWLFLPEIQHAIFPVWQDETETLYFVKVTLYSGFSWEWFFFQMFMFFFFHEWIGDLESTHIYHLYVYTGPEVWQSPMQVRSPQPVPVKRYFRTPSSKISPP